MAERETIRKLVAEELARPEVQDALADQMQQTLWERVGAWLRHPLIITIAGFALTFFVGSTIENQLANSRKESEAQRQAIDRIYAEEDTAKEVVKDFLRLVHLRAIESSLLRSAITRRSTPELLDRKAAYDASYREWNQREPIYRVALRDVWAGSNRSLLSQISPYEKAIADHIAVYFGEADACLTRHFDEVVDAVHPEMQATNVPGSYCNVDDWVAYVQAREQAVRDCAIFIRAVGAQVLRDRTDAKVAHLQSGGIGELIFLVEDLEAEVTEMLGIACAVKHSGVRDGG